MWNIFAWKVPLLMLILFLFLWLLFLLFQTQFLQLFLLLIVSCLGIVLCLLFVLQQILHLTTLYQPPLLLELILLVNIDLIYLDSLVKTLLTLPITKQLLTLIFMAFHQIVEKFRNTHLIKLIYFKCNANEVLIKF